MNSEIEKSEPSPDDVLAAIQSFNDPNIIVNLFRSLGWTYSVEIKETVTLAQQNANMSIKFKAIKYLRELLREAAETAGYTAEVSQTFPNVQGGSTTFSAKRISGILNPVKKIESTEIKESQNDAIQKQQTKEARTEPNRGSDRGQGQDTGTNSPEPVRDTGCAFPPGDVDSGGTEPPDGGETSRQVPGAETTGGEKRVTPGEELPGNPCISTRPPTCDQNLFPGIVSAEE